MPRRPALPPAVALAVALGLAAHPARAGADPARGEHRPDPIFRPERAAAPGAHLLYFGGRVLSRVEVVMVLWGDGHYAPYVTGLGSPSLPDLLAAVAGSGYVAGLAEYDTTGPTWGGVPGTGQHIGPGTFRGISQIAPASSSDVVDDPAIAAELAEQLAKGVLPPPRLDAAGNAETLYVVYFPAGKSITLGSDRSCRTFCAYHGAFPWQGRTLPYAVMPDLSPGSGCERSCGDGEPFANAGAVVSHELAEAVTDPDVSAASAAGPPLAWYDPLNGEIGDLCVGDVGLVTGTDGASWPVQKLWSNARGACVVPAAPAPLVASSVPTPAAGLPPAPARAAAIQPASDLTVAPPRRAAMLAIHPALAMPTTAAPTRPPALPSEPSPLPLSRRVRFAIEEENDGLRAGPHPSDELYTQGLRVSARWGLQPGADHGAEIGFAVGQNIYTPSDLRTTDLSVLRHDRPYAGWLYAAFLLRTEGAAPWSLRLGADAAGRGNHVTEVELALGVTGPESGAADVQTRFHAALRQWSGSATSPPAPAGWSVYQLATQPTVDTSFHHQFDLVQASVGLGSATTRTGSVLGIRLSPRARLDAGSILDAVGLGLEVRAGLVPGPVTRARRSSGFELYGFARADGRYVLHNAFIEGPLRYGVTSLVEVQPWVGDLDVGAVLRLGHLELGAGQLWRTSELAPNPPGEKRVHEVGQVTIAWTG